MALLAALTAIPLVAAAGPASARPTTERPTAAVARTDGWGVYVGPGAKNVVGAPAFARATGLPITRVVDFLPTGSWAAITSSRWLLTPYAGAPLALELSVPLLPDDRRPDGRPWTLAECATGGYDVHWATLARTLVAERLPTTTLRPGWEFNGSWYRWSAAGGKAAAFRGCFQHLVTTMRSVPGARFTFDWNPNIGPSSMSAEDAYPGDPYVDVIGIDVYDLSWTWYPAPAGTTTTAAREKAWAWLARGDHGLSFWTDFAARHGKPLVVPEWGVTARPDGHGGGDNTLFLDRMMDFVQDPANNVAWNHYLNVDTATVQHDLTRAGTRFPLSAARLRTRAGAQAAKIQRSQSR